MDFVLLIVLHGKNRPIVLSEQKFCLTLRINKTFARLITYTGTLKYLLLQMLERKAGVYAKQKAIYNESNYRERIKANYVELI